MAPRASRCQVSLAFFGISSGLFFLIMPVSLAVRFGTVNALIGTALAVVYSALVAGGMAYYAARTGQTANDHSTQLFGRSGGALPTAVLCLTGCWYAVFEGSILAVAAAKVFGIPYEAAACVVALYTTPLGMGSVQHVLDRLNGILLPFTIAGVIALVAATGARVGISDAWLHLGPPEPNAGAWWECFAAFGSCALLGPIAMDYAHADRPEDAEFLAFVPFGVPFLHRHSSSMVPSDSSSSGRSQASQPLRLPSSTLLLTFSRPTLHSCIYSCLRWVGRADSTIVRNARR